MLTQYHPSASSNLIRSLYFITARALEKLPNPLLDYLFFRNLIRRVPLAVHRPVNKAEIDQRAPEAQNKHNKRPTPETEAARAALKRRREKAPGIKWKAKKKPYRQS